MMRSCVTISLEPQIKGGPWIFTNSLGDSMACAAACGFDGVELFFDDSASLSSTNLRAQLDLTGLKLAALGTGAGKVLHGLTLTHPDASIRTRACEYVERMIDFGSTFGAPVIIGSMQGSIAEPDRERALDWLAESLSRLLHAAQAQNVGLILEPLNRYETNIMNRLSDATAFLISRGLMGASVLADLFHMNIEEDSLEDAILGAANFIGHVHLADSNRRPAGLGHIDMAAVAGCLRLIGYQGYISAEALSYPNAIHAATQTLVAFRRWFQ